MNARVMKCRLCGRKYVVYPAEVRVDPSVCRKCEQEATSADQQQDSGLYRWS